MADEPLTAQEQRHLHRLLLTLVERDERDYQNFGTFDRESGPDGWHPDCSCGCKHALWLEGPLGGDWLVCGNPSSHRAGKLTFEHQGCPKFEDEDEGGEDGR